MRKDSQFEANCGVKLTVRVCSASSSRITSTASWMLLNAEITDGRSICASSVIKTLRLTRLNNFTPKWSSSDLI